MKNMDAIADIAACFDVDTGSCQINVSGTIMKTVDAMGICRRLF